jgi:uncharacterized coiled-coil DUF342 family protein
MPRTKNTTLMDDPNVKELLSILKESGKNPSDLLDVIGSVTKMEQELSAALKGISSMQNELSTMREERDHPIRTMLQKTTQKLSKTITGLRARIKSIKDNIVGGCKRAVEAFRDKGISALNNLAGFFNIKQNLLDQREGINAGIEQAHDSIAKIEKAAEQYHAAGRALKNIGRSLQGKEPIADIKPNGKLAQLLQAPYRNEIRNLNKSLRSVNKTLASLDRLEKAAEKVAKAERPSTKETMKKLQKQIDADRTAPAQTKTKRREAEI